MSNSIAKAKNIFFPEESSNNKDVLPLLPEILSLPSLTLKSAQKIIKTEAALTLPHISLSKSENDVKNKNHAGLNQHGSLLDWYM